MNAIALKENANNFVFGDIDNEFKIEMLKSFKEIFIKYPKLINTISLVSNPNYMYDYLLTKYNKKTNIKDNLKTSFIFATGIYRFEDLITSVSNERENILFNKTNFVGISFNDKCGYSEANNNIKDGFFSRWSTAFDIKSGLFHEIGHIFAYLFNLTNNPKVLELLELEMKKSNNKLSIYSRTNIDELIAEAFSKYSYDLKYNNLVYLVGSIIEEFYYEFENTDLFDINRRVYFK